MRLLTIIFGQSVEPLCWLGINFFEKLESVRSSRLICVCVKYFNHFVLSCLNVWMILLNAAVLLQLRINKHVHLHYQLYGHSQLHCRSKCMLQITPTDPDHLLVTIQLFHDLQRLFPLAWQSTCTSRLLPVRMCIRCPKHVCEIRMRYTVYV